MFCIFKTKQPNKKVPGHSDEPLYDFVIDSDIHADDAEHEPIETENNGFTSDNGRATPGENSQSQNQVNERDIADRVRKEVDNVVAAVQN